MADIQRSRLENAETELRSIAERHGGAFKSRDIDWQVIRTQLKRLDDAFQKNEADVFNEALEMLVTRLSPPNDLRGQLDDDSEMLSQPMPVPVFELLNRTIDRLSRNPNYSSTHRKDGSGTHGKGYDGAEDRK